MPEGCQRRELVLADCPQRELVLADCPQPVLMLAGCPQPEHQWGSGLPAPRRWPSHSVELARTVMLHHATANHQLSA